MSMDVDDDAVPRRHSHRSDSVKMSSPGPSGGRMPFDPHSQNHQIVGSTQASIHSFPSHPPPDCERLPGSVAGLSPSSLVNRLGKTHDIYQNPGLAGQHGDPLPSLKLSVQDVAPHKRKRTHDLPHTHIRDHNHFPYDDASTDGASSQSRRRKRLRRRTQQDSEFSPLLIMSPGRELDPHMEEETFLATFPTNVSGPSHSIRRHFHLENPPEHGPRILQSGSSPGLDDPEDVKEHGRSDSVSSFAEVALASMASPPSSRLSSLQDFELPRPFEDTDRPSFASIKVHERGLEAPPLFFPTSVGRMGGPWASRESAGSPTDALGHPIRVPQAVHEHGARAVSPRPDIPRLEPGSTNFFGKPLCESPESMDEDARARFELPPTRVAQGARLDSTPRVRSDGRTTGSSDGR